MHPTSAFFNFVFRCFAPLCFYSSYVAFLHLYYILYLRTPRNAPDLAPPQGRKGNPPETPPQPDPNPFPPRATTDTATNLPCVFNRHSATRPCRCPTRPALRMAATACLLAAPGTCHCHQGAGPAPERNGGHSASLPFYVAKQKGDNDNQRGAMHCVAGKAKEVPIRQHISKMRKQTCAVAYALSGECLPRQ